MSLPSLLNSPRTPEGWQRWSFDNAQDHLDIIETIRKTNGNIISVSLTNGGSGYTSLPSVVVDSNGSGASFSITIQGGAITSVSVQSSGQGYRTALFNFVGGGGSGATAEITLNPWVSLPVYQLDPVNFETPIEFVKRHAQTHTDMNQVLGLPNVDLSDINLRDENKIQAWIYSNYQEHNNAHERLGI
jgi:hypothetical protein